MACTRGKASPNRITQQRLFADSGGYCQNPECTNPLFIEVGTENFHIAEMAHIFSATDGGPRTNEKLSKEARGKYENLILLCANCHTAIDKAESSYPAELISEWKRKHVQRLRDLFGVKRFTTRGEALDFIAPVMRENKTIFDHYGPEGEHSLNPESEVAKIWKRKVRSEILPNNRKLLSMIMENSHLLSDEEVSLVDLYRLHVSEFESRHLGYADVVNARFPQAMENIFKGE